MAKATAVRIVVLVGALSASAACGGDDPPSGPEPTGPGIRIVSAPASPDTAAAIASRLLVAEVRDEGGLPRAGVRVRAVATRILDDWVCGSACGISSSSLFLQPDTATQPSYWDTLSVTTDAEGRARFRIRFGRIAGPATVALSVPALGYEDTARFTVRPGRAAQVLVRPRDTAVVRGRSVPLRIGVSDRWGNFHPERPTIEVSGPVALGADGRATGIEFGRARIVASFGSWRDTGFVSVVPAGRIAAASEPPGLIQLLDTDGSEPRRPPHPGGLLAGLAWDPADRSRLVASQAPVWVGPFRLFRVSIVGEWTPLLPAGATPGRHQISPTFSRDGGWIYFVDVLTDDLFEPVLRGAIWRVRRDGSGLAEVVPAPAAGDGWRSPTASPDGARIAFVGGQGDVHVHDVMSGARSTITGLSARDVRWSPVSDRIAVYGPEGLWVVNADGSGRRQVLPRPGFFSSGIDWSPDGRWVVRHDGQTLELIDVDTGLRVPLPFLVHSFGPAWAPE